MNGLSRNVNGLPQEAEGSSSSEQLNSILRNTSRDTKVIFGALRGTFELKKTEVENFFHLVDQRVREQNNPGAAICEVSVYYNDGTSRKFPSIADFGDYSETRKRCPTVVTLHLAYFIQFPDSETPEKQELDVIIRSSESISETIEMVQNDSQVRMSGDKVQVMVAGNESDLGVISYNINHSRVSWGLDIEGHVKSHIETILSKPTKSDIFLKRVAGPLNLFTTVFVGLYCVNLIIDLFFAFLYQSDGAISEPQKLAVAAEYLINGHIAKYIVASIVAAVVFFVLFSSFVSVLTKSMRKPRPSFIILDNADEKRRREILQQYNRRWSRFAAAILMDVSVAALIFFLEDRLSGILG